jgi:two-component system, cell cycle response regulator
MRILIAEDNPVTRKLLQRTLERWNYQVVVAVDGTEARQIMLASDAPKLAILDWIMPGIDGLDICRELRQRDCASYIYTLLLTSKATREDLLKGLAAGADDYLVKPIDLLELQARLRSGQRILDLQDELIGAREAMREQATRDPLTGAWNRRALHEILQREFLRARRAHKPMVVIMLDLDHFKRINDTHGHQAGDAVLTEVAHRVLGVLRAYDSLGRYGGEEFMVIAPGCDAQSGLDLAERLRESVVAGPITLAGDSIPVTLSLGVASLADDPTPESLIHRADQALYSAKNAGRNRYALA